MGFISAPVVFIALLFLAALYGRHSRAGWGSTVNAILGWVIMEAVAVISFAGFFLMGADLEIDVVWVFFLLWQIHYLHRAFIYPLRMRSTGKRNPAIIVFMAMTFNVYNGYINGRFLGTQAESYSIEWMTSPCFIIRVLMFTSGMVMNFHSDHILFSICQPGSRGYRVPYGGCLDLSLVRITLGKSFNGPGGP